MKEETRRAIVVNALLSINGRAPTTIYSYEQGKHTHMSSGYDFDAQAHFTASGSSFYHYGTRSHVQLSTNGSSFSGYDYDEGHHFNGSVRGSSIQVYDYGAARYFSYSV
jgi:hypothetical protein